MTGIIIADVNVIIKYIYIFFFLIKKSALKYGRQSHQRQRILPWLGITLANGSQGSDA